MHRKLLSILVLSILVASILVSCGEGSPCSTLTILSITEGEVFVMKAGTDDWIGAEIEMELEVGYTIRTGNSSGAEITFFDGSTMELEASTEIEIISLDIVCSTSVTTITLEQTIGSIIFRVTKVIDPASRYEVETPTAVVGVRGSAVQVYVVEDGTTWATNLEGDIRVVAQDVELQVPQARQCVVNPGQPPELTPPLSSGALVSGFGTGGVVTSNPSTDYDAAQGIAIDSTAMYVVGYDSSPGNNQWRIEKRSLTDGSLVSGFGTGGVVTVNPSTGSDQPYAIAIDSTAMYVVGYDSSPGDEQWRIEKRSLTDGSLDTGFDTDGVVTSNPSVGLDEAFGIAIDSTAMYVVGYDSSPGDEQWRIEKRSLSDGSLVSGFGTGGVVTVNPSSGNEWASDQAYAIAIDTTAMYVVGFDKWPANLQWRIEKRSLADGSLVSGFGAGGVVRNNPSTAWDIAQGIAIDSTAMYVVGRDQSPGNQQWRIEKRSLTDGSPVPGFGTGGVVTNNPSTGHDYANAIAIDSTAMYVVGRDRGPGIGYYQWRIEKRSLTNGNLVPGFGTGGVVTVDPSTWHEQANAIAIDSTAMYVVGWDTSPGNEQWRIEKRS